MDVFLGYHHFRKPSYIYIITGKFQVRRICPAISADLPGHMSRYPRDVLKKGMLRSNWSWTITSYALMLGLLSGKCSELDREICRGIHLRTKKTGGFVCIYIYTYTHCIQNTIQNTWNLLDLLVLYFGASILQKEGRPFPIKTGVIWVPGMYGCI